MSAALCQVVPRCDFSGSVLGQAAVASLKPDREHNGLRIGLVAGNVVPDGALRQGEEGICRAYGLEWVQLQVRYQLEGWTDEALAYCKSALASRYPSFGACCHKMELEAREGALVLRGPTQWILRLQELRQSIQTFVQQELGLQAAVELEENQGEEEAFEQQRRMQLEKACQQAAQQVPAQPALGTPKAPAREKAPRRFERRKPEGTVLNWIIVGAETGNRKNKVVPRKTWVNEIARIAKKAGTPVFMKDSLHELMGSDFKQEFPWEV